MLIQFTYDSPVDPLTILMAGDTLVAVEFDGNDERMARLARKGFGERVIEKRQGPKAVIKAFDAYFGGELTALDALAVHHVGTDFEKSVWAQLRRIPAGHTWSYGEMAKALGVPGGSRAVGRANSLNPISIVVPCHRVIGANGKLTGYAGGLERKVWLLRHEGVLTV